MKFTLHRKPDSKAQKIPFPAMQIAGLADAEALVLRAEEGCILLARDSLSTREIVKVIAFLDEIVTSMAEQLAKKSDEMASLQEEDDPLNAFDEDEIDTLEDFCINLEASGASLLWRMAEMNEAYLYPYSAEYARQRGEESLWRASYLSNMDWTETVWPKLSRSSAINEQLGCWLTRYSSWNGVASTVLRIKSGPVESISHQTNPTISTLWCQSVPLC